jgi:hypothetical protein
MGEVASVSAAASEVREIRFNSKRSDYGTVIFAIRSSFIDVISSE